MNGLSDMLAQLTVQVSFAIEYLCRKKADDGCANTQKHTHSSLGVPLVVPSGS